MRNIQRAKWQPVIGSLPVAGLGRHEVAVKLHVEFWSVAAHPPGDQFYVSKEAKRSNADATKRASLR